MHEEIRKESNILNWLSWLVRVPDSSYKRFSNNDWKNEVSCCEIVRIPGIKIYTSVNWEMQSIGKILLTINPVWFSVPCLEQINYW